jgi:hypothetical protein
MKKEEDEKWLDELISRVINEGEPQFDAEKWKQKYPEEFQLLKSRAGQPSTQQVSIWIRTIQSRITKLAAAAVIIIAVGLFLVHRGPDEQVKPTEVTKVTKSPAEMMTLASFTFAYRRGGIEAVEEMCDKAFKMAGPRPAKVSIQELLEEFNGQDLERKTL